MLQVLDLGVTRLLVHRLVRVFPHICEGYYPLCESIAATLRVANKRIEFMGRRSRASNVPGPGYVSVIPTVVLPSYAHLLSMHVSVARLCAVIL